MTQLHNSEKKNYGGKYYTSGVSIELSFQIQLMTFKQAEVRKVSNNIYAYDDPNLYSHTHQFQGSQTQSTVTKLLG